MISYLCNRHYYCMTQLLPETLRPSQPQVLYYKTFINQDTLNVLQKNQKINHRTLALRNKKNPLKRQKTVKIKEKYADGCPVCYEQHINVQYHGHKHICTKCRNLLRDEHGNQVKVFLNEKQEIICLGIYPKGQKPSQKITRYYVTDHTKLEVANFSVYATFGGFNELVLVTRDTPILEMIKSDTKREKH